MLSKVKFPLYMSVARSIDAWHIRLHFNQVELIKLGPFQKVSDIKAYLFTEAGLTQGQINQFFYDNMIEDKK
jgi:hypothetical protein